MHTRFAKTEGSIFHNTKYIEYLDGEYRVKYADRPVYKEAGWEAPPKAFTAKPKNMENETRSDSLSRAKGKFVDICRCNRFDYFFTLTFDPDKANSYDVDEVKRIMQNFFSNLVQRNNAKYILVPEFHKSKRIHVHGFLTADVSLKYSGTVKVKGHKKPMKEETARRNKIPSSEWRPVYNLPCWKYGFSTVIKLSDISDVVNMSKYMTKYICKDLQMIFSNYYFAGGKDLVREPHFELYDFDFDKIDMYEVEYTNQLGTRFKEHDTANVKNRHFDSDDYSEYIEL